MKRRKLTKKASKKNFTNSAVKVHKKNLYKTNARGGIRL